MKKYDCVYALKISGEVDSLNDNADNILKSGHELERILDKSFFPLNVEVEVVSADIERVEE